MAGVRFEPQTPWGASVLTQTSRSPFYRFLEDGLTLLETKLAIAAKK
jgi:hypothetical protein